MTIVHEALRIAAALPPPPEPDARPTRDPTQTVLLIAGGLVVAAALALAVRLLRARSRAATRAGGPAPPTYRLEHWRDGSAAVLRCGGELASMDTALAGHIARLRAEGTTGALVVIEETSDAIVALRPVWPEGSRPPPPARVRPQVPGRPGRGPD